MTHLGRLANDALNIDSVWAELRKTGYETALSVHLDAVARWESLRLNPRVQ